MRVFFLGIFLIIALGSLVDPAQSTGQRIFFGVSFALVAVYLILTIIEGVRSLKRGSTD